MVPVPDLPQAIVLNSVGMNIARSVGPALGGMIVAAAGAAAAFAANALSYVALMLVLFRWRPETLPRKLPPESLGTAMSAGIRFVAMSPTIRTVLLRAFVFGLAGSAVQALMPLIARDLVRGGPVTFGLLLGGFGAGAVAGGLFEDAPPSGARRGGAGSSGVHGFRNIRPVGRFQYQPTALYGGDGFGRSLLGFGSVIVQRSGADLLTEMGGRADACALPDRGVRRHGVRQLGLGSARGATWHQRGASSLGAGSSCWAANRPCLAFARLQRDQS